MTDVRSELIESLIVEFNRLSYKDSAEFFMQSPSLYLTVARIVRAEEIERECAIAKGVERFKVVRHLARKVGLRLLRSIHRYKKIHSHS